MGRIDAESPIARNDTLETIMEQHSEPTTAHISRRDPIRDDDDEYNITQLDREAALILVSSYDRAYVVDIDGIMVTAAQLRCNVTQNYISSEVILFQILVVTYKCEYT